MKYRILGKTGWKVSEISLGTWQVGGGWGGVFDEKIAHRIIHTAIDEGVNFIDTADVYGSGMSEAAVGKIIRERSEQIYVATKCGRKINPHVNEEYKPEVLRKYVEDSLENLGLDTIDLIQLHCPPSQVYQRDDIFELFEKLKQEGKIQHMGVSVEQVNEAIMALKYDIVSTIQIIFNMFRPKPAEILFGLAKVNNVGIIVRVPLASGLLSGKIDAQTTFNPKDHRSFNRNGEHFDKGETFSGVPFEQGIAAVKELKEIFKGEGNLAAWAIRWILMFPHIATVIPGASREEQVRSNVNAGYLPALSEEQMLAVQKVYEKFLKEDIHQLW